jgi:hypothetical protein
MFVWMLFGVLICHSQVPSSSVPQAAPSANHGTNSAANPAAQAASQVPPVAPTGSAPMTLAPIVVTGTPDVGQATIDPSLGIRIYTIDSAEIQTMPQGADTSFDKVVERAPGVSQDAYGSWHVRGEDVNTSYLINGVRIPLGIVNSTFGEKFDTRFISSVSLLEGALPAQFGLNAGGIFDLQTKRGSDLEGGAASIYGGSYDTVRPSFSSGGVSGNTDYFFQGSYDRNDIGIENPTSSSYPLHDHTDQYQGFAYINDHLDDGSQLMFMLSGFDGDFQIPNTPGILSTFALPNHSLFNSTNLNETQNEQFDYGIVSYKKTIDDFNLQSSLISSYARTLFRPDPFGDLMINGLASEQNRSLTENTWTNDVTYQINEDHLLKAGTYVTSQIESAATTTKVFRTDPSGAVLSDIPMTIEDGQYKEGWLYGFYLEDQWQATHLLTVNYGFRFDQVDEFVTENQISPRVNFVYQATPSTALHLGYSRFFEPAQLEYLPPSSVRKYLNTTDAPSVTLDDKPKAERSNYYDIGVTHQVNKNWQIGMEGYYKSIRNVADEAQVGDSLIYVPFSYTYGYYVGAEFTSSYAKDGFSAYTNLEVGQAKARDLNSSQFLFGQDELDYTAQHDVHVNHDQFITLSAGAAYTFMDTTVHIDTIYSSGFYDGFADLNKVAAHYPVDIGLEHDFKLGKDHALSIRCDVINLFDESYVYHHGSGIGTTAPYYGERRGVFGGVTYTF